MILFGFFLYLLHIKDIFISTCADFHLDMSQKVPKYFPNKEDMKKYYNIENPSDALFPKKDHTKLNVLLISTTVKPSGPRERPSTSQWALEEARTFLLKEYPDKVNPVIIDLNTIEFKACEGNYSKSKNECSWPCQITLRDDDDHLNVIYYGLVDWADVVVVGTPIRYGQPSALYYKLVERLTCVHNQLTLNDTNLLIDKVAAFVITGGQDNIQAVAGSMILFWSELGFTFAGHSYIGFSRGWYNEDTRSNYLSITHNKEFLQDLHRLVNDAIEMKTRLDRAPPSLERPVPSSYSEYFIGKYLDKQLPTKPHIMCLKSELPKKENMRRFSVLGRHILVANTEEGIFAIEDICSHARVSLANGKLLGTKVVCDAHKAVFDCKTGEPVGKFFYPQNKEEELGKIPQFKLSYDADNVLVTFDSPS